MASDQSDDYRQQVGSEIHRIRASQGLSLRQLALMVGMDYAYLFNIEHGKANPTLSVLKKIADGLGVELKDFFV